MPELPEVETVMRGLAPVLVGQRIAAVRLRRGGLRFPFPQGFAERLTGARVEGLSRRAKYILVRLDNGHTLIVHLGMTGRFSVIPAAASACSLGVFYFEEEVATGEGPHDHVVLTLEGGSRIVFTDPRRFGLMDLAETACCAEHVRLRGLGLEPLSNDFNAEALAQRFAGRKAPLKAALLDQRLIAGLGNIYVCEALFRAGLSPGRRAGTLVKRGRPDPRLEELVRHIRAVLAEAIAAGGSTIRDYAGADGQEGAFQQRFHVYDRAGEACPRCGAAIRRVVQSGRSTFFCGRCQK